ncbi:MAG: hypothetical protein ABEI74_02615 [Candidatus Pacearchaeota archaeon]
MFGKKAQITVFIIIAVLVVASIVLYFVLQDDSSGGISSSNLDTSNIEGYVDSCLREVSKEVVFEVGEGGGYYLPPEEATDSGVSYYLKGDRNLMPSKQEVEEEMAFFISEKLFFCTENFVDFPQYNITQGDISSEVSIERSKVVVETEYPLTIEKAGAVSRIEDFEVEVPSSINVVYNSVDEFMSTNHSNGICVSCLSDITEENDLYVDMFDYNENTTIFVFEDRNYELNNESFEWLFANEYR